MFFSVNVGIIKVALERVITTIEKKSAVPVLSCVLIVASDDGKVVLNGTDLVTEAHGFIDADVKEPGSVCVLADKLNQMVKLLASTEDIIIKSTDKSRNVKIQCGKAKFKFVSENQELFPDLKGGVTNISSIQLKSSDFETALTSVMYAVSSDETQKQFCSVCIDVKDGKANFVATDGHRLARHCIDIHGNLQVSNIMLPRKSALMFNKAVSSSGDEFVSLITDSGRASISVGDFIYTTKLITGTFPDYNPVIPSHDAKVVLDRKLFESSIRKTIVVANQFTHDALFQFGGDSDGLVISAIITSTNTDSSQDFVPCKLNGIALEIGFNARFIQDALKTISTDNVEIYIGDSTSPILIKGENNPDVGHVCMPMRL